MSPTSTTLHQTCTLSCLVAASGGGDALGGTKEGLCLKVLKVLTAGGTEGGVHGPDDTKLVVEFFVVVVVGDGHAVKGVEWPQKSGVVEIGHGDAADEPGPGGEGVGLGQERAWERYEKKSGVCVCVCVTPRTNRV